MRQKVQQEQVGVDLRANAQNLSCCRHLPLFTLKLPAFPQALEEATSIVKRGIGGSHTTINDPLLEHSSDVAICQPFLNNLTRSTRRPIKARLLPIDQRIHPHLQAIGGQRRRGLHRGPRAAEAVRLNDYIEILIERVMDK